MDTVSPLSLTGRTWVEPLPLVPESCEQQLPRWLQGFLSRRGLAAHQITDYLHPRLSTLPDPLLMADMDVAVDRVIDAITGHEPICVYGDYDVDGVCSSTVLVEFLRGLGADVDYYIPNRQTEGYGLNTGAISKICQTTKLLITTDCGITAFDEISVARTMGTDVIIVDHHKVPKQLPPANACLNPHRPDCSFPFKGMCAAGVAFMLVCALRRALRQRGHFNNAPEPDLRKFLDVVAVATVADMVPMRETNRVLVAAGLRQLAITQRPGLQALMKISKIDPRRITASDLGFRIGPRMNARGRLSDAGDVVTLMLTQDKVQALALATELDEKNMQRRALEKETVLEALAKLKATNTGNDRAGYVLYDSKWHPGVLGLVASRIASRFNRPTVVIGKDGKGSGRSISGVDLYQAMQSGQKHLERFGGHTAAAGLTIVPGNIEAFGASFDAAVQHQIGPPPYACTLQPDIELSADALQLHLVDDLESLAPFGQENREPLMISKDLDVRSARVVGDTHLKLNLGGVDAIAFGLGKLEPELPQQVDVVYHLERNIFGGRQSLQLRIEDMRTAFSST